MKTHSAAKIFAVLCTTALLSSCLFKDDNDEPVFGVETGLPVNCRAYVQICIDGYRNKTYTIEQTMDSLERNCGAYGSIWKTNRL